VHTIHFSLTLTVRERNKTEHPKNVINSLLKCVSSSCIDAINFLNDNHIRTLPWPALSPDLNPIEHLWHEIGRRVRRRVNPPESIDQLQRVLTDEWNNIPQASVIECHSSFQPLF
jgi:transposase